MSRLPWQLWQRAPATVGRLWPTGAAVLGDGAYLLRWPRLKWFTKGPQGIDSVRYKTIPHWPILGVLKGREGRAVLALEALGVRHGRPRSDPRGQRGRQDRHRQLFRDQVAVRVDGRVRSGGQPAGPARGGHEVDGVKWTDDDETPGEIFCLTFIKKIDETIIARLEQIISLDARFLGSYPRADDAFQKAFQLVED